MSITSHKFSYLILIFILLNGCAGQSPQTDNPLTQSVDDVITRLGINMPGQYSNFAQHRLDNKVPLLQLEINRQEIPGQFLVVQSSIQDSVPQRQFLWQFRRTPSAELQLTFAPILNGNTGQSCQLTLLPSNEGISGFTNQQECLLPNRENQPIGLLKEFLLNPDRIELGERIYNLESNTTLSDDTKLIFKRQLNYSGWAGKRYNHDQTNIDTESEWLLAQPFRLHNQGDSVELFDNADRSMGYRLELARIVYRADQPEVLRLAVVEVSSGRQIAYAWSSANSPRIGINLGWLQVGMEHLQDD